MDALGARWAIAALEMDRPERVQRAVRFLIHEGHARHYGRHMIGFIKALLLKCY